MRFSNLIPSVTEKKIIYFLGINFNAIIDLICILLFIGAMGKSAQIHSYIRGCSDAMEGPTPVSALIHAAATMVSAGVFW